MAYPNPFDSIDSRLSSIETLLLELKRESQKKTLDLDTSDLLTVPQCAEFLSLSVPSIYGLLHRKELPAMKRGKRVYFRRSLLIAYLEQGRKKTMSEIEAEANSFTSKRKGS